jgi:oligosaccharyltransferase complex subunit gamma
MWGTLAFFSLSAALSIRFLAPVLNNRWTWAFITVLTSLVMTSGYMFTRIRGMPSVASDGSWISHGYQTQYGQETTVIASICMWLSFSGLIGGTDLIPTDGLLSAAFLMLTLVAPLQTSPTKQRIQIYLWSGVVFVLFSVLVSLFKLKHGGTNYLTIAMSDLINLISCRK